MEKDNQDRIQPWSIKPDKLGFKKLLAIGGGCLIAAFYIGTGDISIASTIGAKFGFSLWWTYFILGIAGWALIDMTVRYFLQFGQTPMSIFKEAHPVFVIYMFLTVLVCTMFGSYAQWNACAMVITGIFPGIPLEIGGTISALAAMLFIFQC